MVEDVGGGEAKQPNSGSKQSVLAAIVLGEGGAMRTSVVLESEAVIWIVEIWSAEKPTTAVVERHLRLGTR